MGRTNFEIITSSPETLAAFLSALPALSGPWDEAFHRAFCDACPRADCPKPCPNGDEADRPLWWLMLEAVSDDFSDAPAEVKRAMLENDRALREREAET